MDNIQQNILKALAYFDIFHYPITNEEIQSFLTISTEQVRIDETLGFLAEQNIIFKLDEFYSLQNDITLAARRKKGNQYAAEQMKIAAKAARILSHFPYVRALAISGSLSKNFADEKTDVDFFIITKANKLWIARTIMHLFKKLSFLVGKQNWFCMNYYIDEAMLEIPEKNIFTAMEIVTVIPMYGAKTLNDFLNTNKWVNSYFPAKTNTNHEILRTKKSFLKSLFENIFNTKFGDALDNWLMKVTNERWQRKTAHHKLNEKGICMGMKVNKHFSKPDPKNFQDKVVQQYENKIKEILFIQTITSETTFYPIPFYETK